MEGQNVNIYDFDKTIYNGDSTADFYRFCLRRYPRVRGTVFSTGWSFFLLFVHARTKTQAKERFYQFLRKLPDVDKAVADFWTEHESGLKKWYLEEKRRSDDIIISASPEFLLQPVCDKLGVKLIASRVDRCTGIYDGVNCGSEEKVRRLCEYMPDAREEIEEFYSDSIKDTPLARLAKNAYMVRGDEIVPWVTRGY